jgi:hypothetical protein
MTSKKLRWVIAFSLLATAAQARTQQFTQGWDVLGGMLNYTSSNVTWSVSSTGDFKATYNLVGAQPSFVYQVGLHFYCTANPGMFGRFPSGKTCNTITRQGVQETGTATEFGIVLTDASGNGSFSVDAGTVAAGTYHVEFDVRDGAGCNLIGGASNCNVIFQSPGPFGTGTTIVVP